MQFVYLTIDHVVEIHGRTLKVSGGGLDGQLNVGQLQSVLEHIQNDDYYPTIVDKVAHLFFSVIQFHCFRDGNKRLAISLSLQFLLFNGYAFLGDFCLQMENISYHVASGAVTRDLLRELIAATLDQSLDSNENLKLRLIKAIQGMASDYLGPT
ncbi:MAG: type II toxin-antitoxin system death-on-curing family toxin [Planctomycetota bacterium]|nr:MAG: type II toxin-antitoxin system death-on-curing family toxin [Planctomycetota bacterium]